jgi:hypothetical protein
MTNYDLILDNEGNKMVLRPRAFGLNPAISSDYIGDEQSYNEQVAASELKKAAGAERISIYDIYEMEDQLTNEGNF